MAVRKRIPALRRPDKKKHPEYAIHMGLRVRVVKMDRKEMEEKYV